MTDPLLSGHAPLDLVLGGGLPANGISLIMGLPGTGKTIVAQQYVFRNGRPEAPAVYFSTVSEPVEKIVRFGQGFDFFDRAAIGKSVFYEDLGETLSNDGLAGVASRIGAVLRERRPGLVVIDSFKALQEFADDRAVFRRFLHELSRRLGTFPVTSLWVGEYEGSDAGSMPEFAVADAIVELLLERVGQRQIRYLEVRKLRGSDFRSGRHAYRLAGDGVHVFPRLADVPREDPYALGDVRTSSGIAALDELLGDGFSPGAATLIAGPSGAGKTLMGLHFIFSGARHGQPGVIASLQENAAQLERVVKGFGWSLNEPHVEMIYRSPVDVYVDEWVYELMKTVERTGAKRVFVDSIADLRIAAPEETRFLEFAYSLVQRLSRQGINLLMTLEIPDLFGAERLSDTAVSHLSDNIVMLSYVKGTSSIKRAMSVLKARASRHEPTIREFLIGPAGIILADRPSPPAASPSTPSRASSSKTNPT